jgi:hypothetical protein
MQSTFEIGENLLFAQRHIIEPNLAQFRLATIQLVVVTIPADGIECLRRLVEIGRRLRYCEA